MVESCSVSSSSVSAAGATSFVTTVSVRQVGRSVYNITSKSNVIKSKVIRTIIIKYRGCVPISNLMTLENAICKLLGKQSISLVLLLRFVFHNHKQNSPSLRIPATTMTNKWVSHVGLDLTDEWCFVIHFKVLNTYSFTRRAIVLKKAVSVCWVNCFQGKILSEFSYSARSVLAVIFKRKRKVTIFVYS